LLLQCRTAWGEWSVHGYNQWWAAIIENLSIRATPIQSLFFLNQKKQYSFFEEIFIFPMKRKKTFFFLSAWLFNHAGV
jgi:hypothetical protein